MSHDHTNGYDRCLCSCCAPAAVNARARTRYAAAAESKGRTVRSWARDDRPRSAHPGVVIDEGWVRQLSRNPRHAAAAAIIEAVPADLRRRSGGVMWSRMPADERWAAAFETSNGGV